MNVRKSLLQRIVWLGLLGCFASASAQEIDYKGFPQWSWHKEDSTEYYLYTPANMEAGKKYPVALFLHGCCGETDHATLRNTVDPPVRMWHNFGANQQRIPTYIIAPATSKGWKQHFASLKKVMDELIAHQQADSQRIYVCGFSMGGEGSFRIIQQYPGYFAAAIPMGMSFSGDSLLVKDIPLWINQGETDWYSRFLRKQVAAIRALNGYTTDTGSTWVTGINPRYSNFKGVGHGVQWNAASTQDLTAWAYAHVNDGNKYPAVFFEQPNYKSVVNGGNPVQINIRAQDPDGHIQKVLLYQNKQLVKIFTQAPYEAAIGPAKGDNLFEAVAYDNQGKTSTATTIVRVRLKAALTLMSLPAARMGDYYNQRFPATGNGRMQFKAANAPLPNGLRLYPDGTLKGVPLEQGVFNIKVTMVDEDGDTASRRYKLLIRSKQPGEVTIGNAVTRYGGHYQISKMIPGETPNFDSRDSVLTTDPEEINFSGLDPYRGLTYIKTDIQDANKKGNDFLSFTVDENVIVYVAYEKLDLLKQSGIPEWLQAYQKEPGEIVAQYRYFNVFSKQFVKGTITLPAADAKTNKVGSNYFIMVRKAN